MEESIELALADAPLRPVVKPFALIQTTIKSAQGLLLLLDNPLPGRVDVIMRYPADPTVNNILQIVEASAVEPDRVVHLLQVIARRKCATELLIAHGAAMAANADFMGKQKKPLKKPSNMLLTVRPTQICAELVNQEALILTNSVSSLKTTAPKILRNVKQAQQQLLHQSEILLTRV